MTNATVAQEVDANDGKSLSVKYKEGEKKVVVPGYADRQFCGRRKERTNDWRQNHCIRRKAERWHAIVEARFWSVVTASRRRCEPHSTTIKGRQSSAAAERDGGLVLQKAETSDGRRRRREQDRRPQHLSRIIERIAFAKRKLHAHPLAIQLCCGFRDRSGIPTKLVPPQGGPLVGKYARKRSNIRLYRQEGGSEWPSRPRAELVEAQGRPFVKHYAGPTWEAPDGSKIVGKIIASEPLTDGRNSLAAVVGRILWIGGT